MKLKRRRRTKERKRRIRREKIKKMRAIQALTMRKRKKIKGRSLPPPSQTPIEIRLTTCFQGPFQEEFHFFS